MVLTELRKIYRISMQELAKDISVSKQLIGKIEKGERNITDAVLNKLVVYFGINNEVTDDYRKFIIKDSMDNIEINKIKMIKINREAEEIEIEIKGRMIKMEEKMINMEDVVVVLDLEAEKRENSKKWMVVKTTFFSDYEKRIGEEGIAIARDLYGNMETEDFEELLENELFTESEAEKKAIEWAEKTGLRFMNN